METCRQRKFLKTEKMQPIDENNFNTTKLNQANLNKRNLENNFLVWWAVFLMQKDISTHFIKND